MYFVCCLEPLLLPNHNSHTLTKESHPWGLQKGNTPALRLHVSAGTPSSNTPTMTSRPRLAPGPPPPPAKAAKARRAAPLAPLATKIPRTNDLRFTTFLSRQARCWCGCTDSTSTTPTAPYQTRPPSSSHRRGSSRRRQTNLSTSKPPDDPRDRWQALRACRRGPGTPGSWRGCGGRTRETGLMAGVAMVVGKCGSILSAVLHGKAGRAQRQSGEAKGEAMRRRTTTYRERLRCL